ncbi:MAG TPA: aldo/keto reductase [Dehalococcoidales bacterium]|nr:aldo/keto reductase [Dehalococcoidales bacterium]
MQKIRLGKTGLMVTPLGFGGIPIQRLSEAEAVKVVSRCLDLGLNYIDTANAYTVSEERVGKTIKGRKRSDIIIATKTGSRNPDDMRKNLDLSLQRMGTDYIDLYQFHQIGDMATLKKILDPSTGMMKVFEDAKKAGKIRHIGASSHQMDVAKEIVKSDAFETMLFPFNFITSEPAVELLPLCRQHDVGFIVMKPLAGGMLDNATLCFKYLLQFPDVLTIPGIEKVEEIEEIVKIYEGPHKLTAAEKKQMEGMKAELGTRFCRRCDYCRPCQQEIPISMVMSFPSMAKRMPPERIFGGMYEDAMTKASNCLECGECESRCPFHLPIREMLKENVKAYQERKKMMGR